MPNRAVDPRGPRCSPTSTCCSCAVFCTADDLLPERPKNARRRVTDAEVVTLCVAQAVMDIDSDREFLAVARKRLSHLFPELPKQPGYLKRRRRLAETIDWLTAVFASDSPGSRDPIVLLDSTPVECGRSVETARRSELRRRLRLRLLPLPLALVLGHAPAPGLRPGRHAAGRDPRPGRPEGARGGAAAVADRACTAARRSICDKGYAGSDFEQADRERFGATVLRPSRADEPDNGLHLSEHPPADRVGLLDAQGPTRPRTPPRPHPRRHPRPRRQQTARPRRRSLAQPPRSAAPRAAFADLAA